MVFCILCIIGYTAYNLANEHVSFEDGYEDKCACAKQPRLAIELLKYVLYQNNISLFTKGLIDFWW